MYCFLSNKNKPKHQTNMYMAKEIALAFHVEKSNLRLQMGLLNVINPQIMS